jgi:hypothetical protein
MKPNQIQLAEHKLSDGSKIYAIQIFDTRSDRWVELNVANRNEAYELKAYLDALVIDVMVV